MHRTTPEFWKRFAALPGEMQELARKNFALLRQNPRHPSLHLERVGDYWSARVGSHYRAIAVEDGPDFVWVWIGSHSDYDMLIH